MAEVGQRPGMVDDQYRGLLTQREREIIKGEADVSDNYRYRVVSRVRTKIENVGEDIRILNQNRSELLEELREVVCTDTAWLRDELETKRNKIEEEFPDLVPKITRFNSNLLGLWIRVNTSDDYWKLLDDLDRAGDYLHSRGYNVRAAYDTEFEVDEGEPHYEGHLYALPAEVGTPEYPVGEMPVSTDTIEKNAWDANS